ncbi:hypothetical protein RhiirC2_719500 [Rhizophagus irregularis]|uniref:Uncharacterized protein n=1 Tax=Rhizophagus irregularis TaxID=588596 RepID=A0A2N1ME15_9GLOM|nr:hypothetical protein RhiirC2_719500 [Rhizophagus irregularis]
MDFDFNWKNNQILRKDGSFNNSPKFKVRSFMIKLAIRIGKISECYKETFGVQRIKSAFRLLEGSKGYEQRIQGRNKLEDITRRRFTIGRNPMDNGAGPRPAWTKSCFSKMGESNSSNVTIQFIVVGEEERQDSNSQTEKSFAGEGVIYLLSN